MVDLQEKMDGKKNQRDNSQPLEDGKRNNLTASGLRNSRKDLLTRENLQTLDGNNEILKKLFEDENFSVESQHQVDIKALLTDLNLPLNLFQKMEEMPSELWPYILDEVIYEA